MIDEPIVLRGDLLALVVGLSGNRTDRRDRERKH
jgi:hypothetical protein